MKITEAAIKNRTFVFVLTIIISILGLYSYISLPTEASPDVTIPYVFVTTKYNGGVSSDIETSITIPIEKKLRNIQNVKTMKSSSTEGLSRISIEFETGTDIKDALREVSIKVDEAKKDLPNDLDNAPEIYEINLSERPVVTYSINGTSSLKKLKSLAENVKEKIEAVAGVLAVNIYGSTDREIIVEIDPDKLAYYNIPISVFYDAV